MAKTLEVDTNSKPMAQIKPEDLIKGKTPDDIESRCLELCHQFLGGHWIKATECDIEVRRISGGLSGQLFHVKLASNFMETQTIKPRQVAIKFHQKCPPKSYYKNNYFTDLITSTVASDMEVGPTIYGLFGNGFIQGYYQFRVKHQQNALLLRKLAHKLAHFHLLNVPIPKNDNTILDKVREGIEYGLRTYDVPAMANQLGLRSLSEHNLKLEFTWFDRYFRSLESSPTVFSHNDFRGSNILVLPDQSILLCDFEASSYGPRFIDLGSFLAEWGRELFDFKQLRMLEPEVLQQFAELYLEGCDLLIPGYSSQLGNSLSEVIYDAKLGLLFNSMFLLAMTINVRDNVIEKFTVSKEQILEGVEIYFQNYLSIKQSLTQEGFFILSH